MHRVQESTGGSTTVTLKVVGAGVGRTGTNSLKLALEQLLGEPCHHMLEIITHPEQIPGWMAAIDGGPVDWTTMPPGYGALVDWPGASFWPELSAANPDALVLLSVRDPEEWYRSASNTIFQVLGTMPPDLQPWFDSVRALLGQRFSDHFDDATAMMDAFERHNASVRAAIDPARLLEWQPSDGWAPICERLGVAVPDEPFPRTNSTNEWRANLGMSPVV
jgi:sulfotransferase family protein